MVTDKEITESNKTIAEFMGYRVFNKRYPNNHGIGGGMIEYKDCIAEKLKYHKSWDALMPVIEKIEEHGVWFDIKKNFVDLDGVVMTHKGYRNFRWYGGHTHDSKLTSTWYGVVAFIKWYNENLNKNE